MPFQYHLDPKLADEWNTVPYGPCCPSEVSYNMFSCSEHHLIPPFLYRKLCWSFQSIKECLVRPPFGPAPASYPLQYNRTSLTCSGHHDVPQRFQGRLYSLFCCPHPRCPSGCSKPRECPCCLYVLLESMPIEYKPN